MIEDYKIHELISMFLDDQDVNKLSVVTYNASLNNYFLWLAANKISYVKANKIDIKNYRQNLIQRYTSSYTVRNYFTVVQLFYSWLQKADIYEDISFGLKKPKYEIKINKNPLSVDQVNRLFSIIDNTTLQGKRDTAIIKLMLHNGLRRIEITRLDIGDINPNNEQNRILVLGKGRTAKEVMSLDDSVLESINDYLIERKSFTDADPLFINHSYHNRNERLTPDAISVMVKKLFNKLGFNKNLFSSHSLRHTTAVSLLEDGMNPYDVKTYMRHRSFSSTEVYLRFLDEQKRLNNTVGNRLAHKFKYEHENN